MRRIKALHFRCSLCLTPCIDEASVRQRYRVEGTGSTVKFILLLNCPSDTARGDISLYACRHEIKCINGMKPTDIWSTGRAFGRAH